MWRGFYVAMYMHDSKSPLSVQKLIAQLAGTVTTMYEKDQEVRSETQPNGESWLYLWTSAFWETVCREWSAIDQWRMNKMLLLVRFFVREIFNLSLQQSLSLEPNDVPLSASQLPIFEEWPLSTRERKVPDGLRLHVLDVWVDELSGQLIAVQKQTEGDDNSATVEVKAILTDAARAFMLPVEMLSKEAISKGVKMKAKEVLGAAADKLAD
jgi:ribosomal RNA-processing protein 1